MPVKAAYVLAVCIVLAGADGKASAQIPVSGPATPANAQHADDQEAPSVALAQDGNAVLLFSDNRYNKRLRWLDENGVAYGPEPGLHLGGDSFFSLFQDVSVTRKGTGVACGEFNVEGRGRCRLLDTRGHLGDREIYASDDPFQIDQREFHPRVDTFPDGGFVVGWLDYVAPAIPETGDLLVDPTLRFFTADGAPAGPDIMAEHWLEGDVRNGDVAALGGGRAVMVWNGDSIDSDASGVRARIVGRDGTIGPPILVNTYQVGDQMRPNVASNGDDRFVVTWESYGQDGSGGGVYGQLFDGQGSKLGGEFQVSSGAPTFQGLPEVAMDRTGRFVVAFYSAYETDERGEDILLRAYHADGTPLGPQVFVSEPDADPLDYPTVALSDSGLVQVAFQAPWYPPEDPFGNYDILTRRFVLPCESDVYTLCLGGGRFAVRAFWRTSDGAEDLASRVPLSADTGGFYFFDPTNFELLVKVLDGCAINQRFWVFAAGLTDVEVDVLVTDTFTGRVRIYHNGQGQAFVPVQDLEAFDGCGASAPARFAPAEPPATITTPCAGGPDVLCLAGGRFRVGAQWTDFGGHDGSGIARPQSANSGLFHFFSPDNLELAVKVLDGCALNGHYWVYAAGLTNVGVTLTVEDLATGATWQRQNPLGAAFPPLLDSAAFAGCPQSQLPAKVPRSKTDW